MNKRLLRHTLTVAAALFGFGAQAQSTILDPGFGTNGKALTSFTTGAPTDQARAVALQPDGKIVVAGYGSGGLEVARYTAAGALDASFGSGGKYSMEFGALSSSTCVSCNAEQSKGLAVYVQADGKIVVGGRRSSQWLVTRLLANGTLDTTLGTAGAYTLLAGTLGGQVSRIGQQSGGELIVVGNTTSLNQAYVRVVRLLNSGSADASFAGTVPVNSSSFTFGDALVDAADRTVVFGQERFQFSSNTPHQLVAYRFLPNGQLDAGFGASGRAPLPAAFTGYNLNLNGALAPLPNGQLLVAAILGAANGGSAGVGFTRLQANGSADTSFGTNGVATVPTQVFREIRRVQVQPDGKFVIIGITPTGPAQLPATPGLAMPASDFALARFTASGQLDTSYGVNGVVRIHQDNLDELADLALQPDGKAVAVGYTAPSMSYSNVNGFLPQNSQFAVLRVLPTANCTMVSAGADQSLCAGTSLPLGLAPQDGLTYSWAVSPAVSGFSSSAANATFTAPPVSTPTTYTLTLNATAGSQCTAAGQVQLTVLPGISPALAAQSTPSTISIGQSVALSVPNPQAGVTYTWTGPGLQATTGATVTATPAAGLSTAQYQVTATLGTCSRTASILVSVAVPGTPLWAWVRAAGTAVSNQSLGGSTTDAAGNTYVVVNYSDSTFFGQTRVPGGYSDIAVAKYAADGTVQWVQHFGGAGVDAGTGIAIGTQNDLYLTGRYSGAIQMGAATLTSNNLWEMFVARLDATNGSVAWAITNTATGTGGTNVGSSVATAANGDVLVSGEVRGTTTWGAQTLTGGINTTWLVLRLTPTGTVVWARSVGNGSNSAFACHLACDNAGNVYVIGSAQGPFTLGTMSVPAGQLESYLVSFSAQGQPQWWRQLVMNSRTVGSERIAADAAGNVYVSCVNFGGGIRFPGATAADDLNTTRTAAIVNNTPETFLACYNAAGTPVWARNLATCGTGASNWASALAIQGSSLYATGDFTGSSNFGRVVLPSSATSTAFVAKYSLATGQNDWAQQSGLGQCAGTSLGIDAVGNSYVGGGYGTTGAAFGLDLLPTTRRIFLAKLGTSLLTGVRPGTGPAARLQVYPNPWGSHESLRVQLPTPALVQDVSLYSTLGQLVYRRVVGAAVKELELPAEALAPGVYYLRVQTPAGVLGQSLVRE